MDHLIRLWQAQRQAELDQLLQLRQASGTEEDLYRLVDAAVRFYEDFGGPAASTMQAPEAADKVSAPHGNDRALRR